jgi:DtxR family Mn-dependent transcriptional regulator
MEFSFAEENYLKAIYHLSQAGGVVSTNAIADELHTSPASVTDMLKKLAGKEALHYVKYKGVSMTPKGMQVALWVIRKHRLWEVFLVDKLRFSWDEVHEVAEQLEHIRSKLMIERLDEFLGFPKVDPHGDPIPDQHGHIDAPRAQPLTAVPLLLPMQVMAVKDTSTAFLKYLDKLGIGIGTAIRVLERMEYDGSLEIAVGPEQRRALISSHVGEHICVAPQ